MWIFIRSAGLVLIFLITFFSSNFIVISSRFGTTSLLPRPNSLFPRPPPSPAPRSTQDVQEPQPRQKWQIRPTLEGDEERSPRTRVTVRPPAAGRARVRYSKDLQRETMVLCISSDRCPTSKPAAAKGPTHRYATPRDPTSTTSRSTCWTPSSQRFWRTTSAWCSVQYNQSTGKLMLLFFSALLLLLLLLP